MSFNFSELPETINCDLTFLCDEEIVDHLKKVLVPSDLLMIKDTTEEDLISFHHTLGQHIRNEYGLWYPNYPYMPDDSNADDFSFTIIQMLHKDLNDEG